jgi:hypothetical protein
MHLSRWGSSNNDASDVRAGAILRAADEECDWEQGESLMTDDIEKKEGMDSEDLKKVLAAAEAKQRRHRVDEYIAMVIAIGAVFILWFMQFVGLY